jgi:hypothetical protein
MRALCRWSATTLVAGSLLLGGCGGQRPEEHRDPIPPGVDVGPPRSGAETGGLQLPGREPTAPLQAGGQEPLTDTVGAVVQQPGQRAPAQPGTGPTGTGQPGQQTPVQPPRQ